MVKTTETIVLSRDELIVPEWLYDLYAYRIVIHTYDENGDLLEEEEVIREKDDNGREILPMVKGLDLTPSWAREQDKED